MTEHRKRVGETLSSLGKELGILSYPASGEIHRSLKREGIPTCSLNVTPDPAFTPPEQSRAADGRRIGENAK